MVEDNLSRALRAALAKAPASRRALAKEARVDHTLLAHVLAGRRRASLTLVRRVAAALSQWGTDCSAAASILRRALKKGV